jgi:hypothetical protein
LTSANFVEPGTKEVDSKPVRESVQSPLSGSQLGNGKRDVVEEQELSLVSSRTQGTNFSSLLSNSAYPGLDGEGQPTGFTVADSQEGFGDLFSGQQRLTLTESGLLVSNIVSTRSGAANILINQSIVVDAFGTSYIASVSAGINGGWQALRLGFVLSEIERLPSGNYLLTAMMQVESATKGAVKVSTGNSGIDLERAPGAISTKVMLDPTKTKILAQAVFVSADSQGNGA